MTDDPHFTAADAVQPDGFVDFYKLIGAAPESATEQLRSRISALYDEAQANRDHRNIHKRREYQLLLELLPHARNVLLDDGKRARYDAYSDQARRQEAPISFDEFLNQMAGHTDAEAGEHVGLLGVHEANGRGVMAQTIRTAKPAKTATAPKSTTAAKTGLQPDAPASIGAALSVIIFMAVLLILKIVAGQEMVVALCLAGLAGGIAWVVARAGFSARRGIKS